MSRRRSRLSFEACWPREGANAKGKDRERRTYTGQLNDDKSQTRTELQDAQFAEQCDFPAAVLLGGIVAKVEGQLWLSRCLTYGTNLETRAG
jgi:hypothetical protein